MIRFRCSHCGKKLKADENIIGRKVQCVRCDHVERVPEKDNLAKPKQPRKLESSADGQAPKLPDRKPPPQELFGHSAVKSQQRPLDGPQFQVTKARAKSKIFKWALPAIGIVAGITLIAVIAYTWIGQAYAEPEFRAEFEAMSEVQFYQNACVRLEKSRRVMSIMVKAFESTSPNSSGLANSFTELNRDAQEYIKNSKTLLTEAAKLMADGKEIAAKSSMVNTAKKMNQLAANIDDEIESFNKTIHNR